MSKIFIWCVFMICLIWNFRFTCYEKKITVFTCNLNRKIVWFNSKFFNARLLCLSRANHYFSYQWIHCWIIWHETTTINTSTLTIPYFPTLNKFMHSLFNRITQILHIFFPLQQKNMEIHIRTTPSVRSVDFPRNVSDPMPKHG